MLGTRTAQNTSGHNTKLTLGLGLLGLVRSTRQRTFELLLFHPQLRRMSEVSVFVEQKNWIVLGMVLNEGCLCVRACACVRVRACVRACVGVRASGPRT